MKRNGTRLLLFLLLLISLGAVGAIIHLQANATASRDAELRLAGLHFKVAEIQDIPWQAMPAEGRSTDAVRRQLEAARRYLEREFADLAHDGVADAQLTRAARSFRETIDPLRQIVGFASRNDPASGGKAAGIAWGHGQTAINALQAASRAYRATAARALAISLYGSAATIALLLAAFAYFFRRAAKARSVAERLTREIHELLEVTTEQATTDALTGLANRRALSADLATAVEQATPEERVMLVLFDLDGFKGYNDTFGHPAGDALLTRLGQRLATTMQGLGTSYRMGGDEFCVLAPAGDSGGESIVRLAAAALSEEGEAFRVGCSYGIVQLPNDAGSPEEALGLADQRMYGQKTSGRASASRQSTDVLVKVLGERSVELQAHIDDVARLAELTAQQLRLPEQDVQTIRLAAELHDIGKVAIPDAILTKPGKLTEEEWAFMRRHTIIGERIALAAPSLTHTAGLIRASHERIDGTGYPDQLRGDQIPLGSRIIAVCDAYDAMVCERPYAPARSPHEAVAELQRCADTQFDAEVVGVVTTLVNDGLARPALTPPMP